MSNEVENVGRDKEKEKTNKQVKIDVKKLNEAMNKTAS